ncbi:MAG TPA: DUF6498-containing protein [Candidatus Limnocylindrales bacterium]|nr:DUF6498-containing protein [Candidatus Limnocylindrales bacterium]
MTVDSLSRAVDVYRRTAASRSAIVLIAANLIPLVGVLFFGWSLWTILVLYWLENGIVGFWNVPKILLAGGVAQQRALDAAAAVRPPAGSGTQPMGVSAVHTFGDDVAGRAGAGGRAALAVFFLMHYGIFWFVHGIFVFLLPSFFGGTGAVECTPGDLTIDPNGFPIPLTDADCAGGFGTIVWSSVVIGAVALFLSHGASFLLNYVGRGEYLTTTPMRQMAAPYGRVVVLHVTIIFGAFAIAFIGAPIGALLILVALKTALDLGLHLRERRSAASPLPNRTA